MECAVLDICIFDVCAGDGVLVKMNDVSYLSVTSLVLLSRSESVFVLGSAVLYRRGVKSCASQLVL